MKEENKKMEKINLNELSKFLVEAKRNTYAGGKKAEILSDGSKELIFEKGNFKYRDRYFESDPNPFIGEEIVWENGKAIWGMNYYGRIVSPDIPAKEIYEFLRKALSKVREFAPFRGLPLFVENNLKYINKLEGDITEFRGEESISLLRLEKRIYILNYHGGLISEEK